MKWSRNINSKAIIVQKANELLRNLSPFWIKNLDYSLNILNLFVRELNELNQVH